MSNWKNAIASFNQHEQSSCHREAVEMMVTLPAKTKNVGEALTRQHAKEKEENRKILLKIISNIRFLAHQGLGLRGDGKIKTVKRCKTVIDGNH